MPKKDNVIVCNNVNEAISTLKEYGIETPYIGGGTSIYTSFLKENLINKIIISYNSVFVSNDKELFTGNFAINNYKISKITPVNDWIICIEMEKNKKD